MIDIDKACHLLKNNELVAIPTETVYGLAGSIYSEEAIHKIFQVKERPFFDPLIIHVSSISEAKQLTTKWFDICDILAKEFWPGPMTLILPKSDNVSDTITSGFDQVGIRIPGHDLTLKLLQKLGEPLAAPSANKFKKTSPTSAKHVISEFPQINVLDGGQCSVGIESTVLAVTENQVKIYRPGMITIENIKKLVNKHNLNYKVNYTESPVSPGAMKHHYMPNTPIVTLWDGADLSEISEKSLLDSPVYWELKSTPQEVARHLYSKFREFDKKSFSAIIIKISSDKKNNDDWKGILNRISKASKYELSK